MADWSSFSSSLAALYEGLLPHGTEMDAVPRKNKGKVDLFLLSAISRAISRKKGQCIHDAGPDAVFRLAKGGFSLAERWRSGRLQSFCLTQRLNVRVVVTLDFGNSTVAFTFPFGHGVLSVPGFHQLALLAGQTERVGVTHIEISAGNRPPTGWWWIGSFLAEVHLHLTLAVIGAVGTVPGHKAEVGTVTVHFATL